MRLTREEIVWGGRAFMPGPGRTRIGGADPGRDCRNRRSCAARDTGRVGSVRRHWCRCPCVARGRRTGTRRGIGRGTARSGERLREIGLADAAVGGERGQHGRRSRGKSLGAAPPEVIVQGYGRPNCAPNGRRCRNGWAGGARPAKSSASLKCSFPMRSTIWGCWASIVRLDELEAGMRGRRSARRRWVEKYQLWPGRLDARARDERRCSAGCISQATAAFHRSPVPAQWGAPDDPAPHNGSSRHWPAHACGGTDDAARRRP